jgi:hypothetical protein
MREKTASASESLADNLAADTADGEETVHGGTMRQPGAVRQYLTIYRRSADFGHDWPLRPRLVNDF